MLTPKEVRLTVREIRLAAEAARRWPRGQSNNWIAGLDVPTVEAIRIYKEDRKALAKKVGPCFAIAVARDELTESGLQEIFFDLDAMFFDHPRGGFMPLLHDNPKELARQLEEYISHQLGEKT